MAGKAPTGSIIGSGDVEAGFSGGTPTANALYFRRRSYRALAPLVPARLFVDDLSDDECHHFLDSCFLCKKHLMGNRDIYMYRGDMPFCSEGCRQEQIELDEARERSLTLSYRKEKQQKHNNSSSPIKSQRIGIRVGAVVPA